MAALVALDTMNLWWMAGFAALIFLEKKARWGEGVARLAAIAFLVTGAVLLVHPATISRVV